MLLKIFCQCTISYQVISDWNSLADEVAAATSTKQLLIPTTYTLL